MTGKEDDGPNLRAFLAFPLDLRREFGLALRDEIRRTVSDESQVDEELRYLLGLLRGQGCKRRLAAGFLHGGRLHVFPAMRDRVTELFHTRGSGAWGIGTRGSFRGGGRGG
jgi:hypothetical protein